jgi:hypothetical protein
MAGMWLPDDAERPAALESTAGGRDGQQGPATGRVVIWLG